MAEITANKKNTVNIGLIGLGTVGTGVAKILLENPDVLNDKTGLNFKLTKIVDKDTTTKRNVDLPEGLLTNDITAILGDTSIDIAVELVGGTTFARDLHIQLLKADKNVVTANKALLAEHGRELFTTAIDQNKVIAFEGSCAGGIPIVSALRTGLAANKITALYGILNGTCNYILSTMTEKGLPFDDILKKAQEKGYAEADPTLDINGHDTAHKLAILARLAFGADIDYEDIYIEGIENTKIDDIRYGLEMGYIMKLLAIGEKRDTGKVSLRVHPSFISSHSPLGRVSGPFNAVSVFGHAVGQTMYYGRGAGMMPTASAVVADIIEVATGSSAKLFNGQMIKPAAMESFDNVSSRFYIRIMAKDQPGVVAAYGKVLGDHNISISGALQHEGTGPNNTVPVVITTHPTKQANMNAALNELETLDVAHGKPVCIRIVDIPEDDIDD
jgi:homoserine dehydrogenase